jgi:hypothetical protein
MDSMDGYSPKYGNNVGKTIMNHPCGNGSYLSTLIGDNL